MRSTTSNKKKKIKQLNFVTDGNKKTFVAQRYQPLLDKHLQIFFMHQNRLNILKKNKLINRKYEILKPDFNKHHKSYTHDRSISGILISENSEIINQSRRLLKSRNYYQSKSKLISSNSMEQKKQIQVTIKKKAKKFVGKNQFLSFLVKEKQKVNKLIQDQK